MPFRRVALLTVLACLGIAGPAGASERSEARAFAAAMQPEIVLTPEQGEAIVVGYEAHGAQIAASCMPAVEAAGQKRTRALRLATVYAMQTATFGYEHVATWRGEADARLAAIDTGSRILRRARAARARFTRMLAEVDATTPMDLCAVVTAWQAKRWKGDPPGAEAMLEVIQDADEGMDRRLKRGARLLRRHGATRAQLRAFNGEPGWPELREPAPDPVLEALLPSDAPDRVSRDESGRRAPRVAPVSGADAR